jgi:hypothetical protein
MTEPSSPASRVDRAGGFALVCGQLALVLVAVRRYEVAARGHFFAVLCVAAAGYMVHAWLPPRLRLSFFALLSLGTVAAVLGWPDGGYLLAAGGGLIAVCYLPLPFAVRATLVAGAAAALTVFRTDLGELTFWPVLGSMFMFRLIVFLIDLRREPAGPPPVLAAAYFFPLPNVSFLFFPILDFRTFRDTYRPDAGWREARDGVGWMAVGLLHLVAYRAIKYHLLPAPHELGDLPHLALFLAAGYALYLHVSGHFHLITGVFHLFGFLLPRTHDHYFLAASFTDIWRRINIPWKEFTAKAFFFPAFFPLRGLGTRGAIAAAAVWVFLMTWLLHAYQVFWITGELPLAASDAWLWLAAGVLVAANLQYDLTRARRPGSARPARLTIPAAAWWAVRVVCMFSLVSVFWALWNAPEVVGFIRAQATGPGGLPGGEHVLAAAGGAVVVLATARLAHDRLGRHLARPAWLPPGLPSTLGLFALAAAPPVAEYLGGTAGRVVASLQHDVPTAAEAARAAQGYYERIADAPVRAGSWFSAMEGRPRPADQPHYREMTRPTDLLLERELIPGWTGEINGVPLSINRHGMRDRPDRTVEKPPGTWRLAVVGSSVVMGYGVADDEPFPRVLEDTLAGGGRRVEVLNFGTGKSFAVHRRALLDRKVWAFRPDAVLYVAHQDELYGPVPHLAGLLAHGVPLPYPCLRAAAAKAGVGPDTPEGVTLNRLRPLAVEIVAGMNAEFAAACRDRGVRPVWAYLPVPGVADAPDHAAALVRMAAAAGFETIDLSGWADGHDPKAVKADEHHPNRLGHRLIADRLAAESARRPGVLAPAGR